MSMTKEKAYAILSIYAEQAVSALANAKDKPKQEQVRLYEEYEALEYALKIVREAPDDDVYCPFCGHPEKFYISSYLVGKCEERYAMKFTTKRCPNCGRILRGEQND